jgi:hypothetical protein
LPSRHRILLVSDLGAPEVGATYCEWVGSAAQALAMLESPPVVLPRAGYLLIEPTHG